MGERETKVPKVDRPKLKLTGVNGNAYSVMGHAIKVLRRAGFTEDQCKEFKKEAMSGDYDNLLQATMAWCDVD